MGWQRGRADIVTGVVDTSGHLDVAGENACVKKERNISLLIQVDADTCILPVIISRETAITFPFHDIFSHGAIRQTT